MIYNNTSPTCFISVPLGYTELYFYSITLSNGHCANRSCINMALLTTKRVGKGELIGIISKGCMCYNCVLKGNKEKKNLADIFSFLILFG